MAKNSSMWNRTKPAPQMATGRKVALITGIGGQDGSYLTRHLLTLGYEVHGTYRRSSVDNLARVRWYLDAGEIRVHMADLSDPLSIDRAVREVMPDEVYHLADQDDVRASKETPSYSMDVTARAVGSLLESVAFMEPSRAMIGLPKCRVFVPITATIFGKAPPPQNEHTPHSPENPYAVAKLAALHLCRYYRSIGVYVSCGIMYNHDSPLRGPGYLLQKICRAAVAQAAWDSKPRGKSPELALTNIDDCVDIGFSGDFVEAMEMILKQDTPDDFVVGTGRSCTLRYIVETAYKIAGVGYDNITALLANTVDTNYRAETLIAGVTKLKTATGWEARTSMTGLLTMIVERYKRDAPQPIRVEPYSPQESSKP
jgi:GDPmannose 4,6-dehydratase